jgi:hypothetical protein
MKKQYIISVVLLIINFQFLIVNCNSQTYFNKDFGNDSNVWNNGNFTHSFADTSGYLVVGSFPGANTRASRFIRLDIFGDTLWTNFFGKNQFVQFPTNGNYVNIGDTNFVFTGILYPDYSL